MKLDQQGRSSRVCVYSAGMTIEDKIESLFSTLENSCDYWKARQTIKQQTLASGKVEPEDVRKALDEVLEASGIRKKLKNLVFKAHLEANEKLERSGGVNSPGLAPLKQAEDTTKARDSSMVLQLPAVEEPRTSVNNARCRWERSITEELLAMGSERGRPLARIRMDDEATLHKNSLTAPRFLFDSEDLRAVITTIEPENRSLCFSADIQLNSIKLMLGTPSLTELQGEFRELAPEHRQAGIDDIMDGMEMFMEKRLVLGKKVTSMGLTPIAQQYAKFGTPASVRPKMWRLALGLPAETAPDEEIYFNWLKQEEQRIDLITDDLFEMDVQFISDDDRYFVFEEVLRDVVIAFSRDPWVLHHCDIRIHEPLLGYHGDGQPAGTALPPCGMQPFRGFVNYVAPLCFLYQDPVPVYFVARAMYCRFWCRLNAIRSQPNTLLPLCKLFEDLVIMHNPAVFLHMKALGSQPLSVVMPWIQFGFVGYLEPDQILLLWDRLVGYQNLTLLPVLSAAIIIFRSSSILKTQNGEELKDIFHDITRLKVVPLLQTFLFHDSLRS